MNKDLRIVFMGTPEIAVTSLDAIIKEGYNVVGVITVPDKPAGRGKKISESTVKQYAIQNNLNILQPKNLKDPNFLNELQQLNPDLQVVVAFRMLPKSVWSIPKLGTFNLHASLLPNYRGAAPINWAIINGEQKTGVTTFFLDEEIDTGNIIFREEIPISNDETAGELHDNMKYIGAKLVIKTIHNIEKGNIKLTPQNELIKNNENLKNAPKIFKEYCKINWNENAINIYDKIRGLSPFPCAFTEILSKEDNKKINLKIFKTKLLTSPHQEDTGKIITDNKSFLRVCVPDGYIELIDIQQSGKNKMSITEFLKGFKLVGSWYALS